MDTVVPAQLFTGTGQVAFARMVKRYPTAIVVPARRLIGMDQHAFAPIIKH